MSEVVIAEEIKILGMMTSTVKPDYWSLLGVSPDCDANQLKIAFRREARKWHPDLNGNDLNAEERFKLINEAYAVLSDPRKRTLWERSQTIPTNQDPFSFGFPEFSHYLDVVLGIENLENENLESKKDFYEYEGTSSTWPRSTSIPQQSSPVPVYEDMETIIELTPEQALEGSVVELELPDGIVVEVDTPPLCGDGWRLRLPGVAKGGSDHFLQVRVQTEDGLRIDGLRVLYKLELFPPDAVLGCSVEVPTLSGPVILQVPPGSSSGRLLRLRGRGLELDERRGDQLVEIVVVIPADIGDAEMALYQRLQELSLEPDSI